MSHLRRALARYLETRRLLGFKLERAEYYLRDFVRFAEGRRMRVISTRLCLEWACQPPARSLIFRSARLAMVRIFAEYLHAEDPRHEVPSRDLLPRPPSRAVPVLLSEREIARLLDAATRILRPYLAATYSTFFGLLAVTGMRIGEAIRLERDDVDLAGRVLTVRESKFNKSREVALDPTTVAALRRYSVMRDWAIPAPLSCLFFLTSRGTAVHRSNAYQVMRRCADAAGVRRSRPHDLRHSFAVRTILGWYRAGVDVDVWMPRLSTYLGHSTPNATYWYLSASPELMAVTRLKLEKLERGHQ